MSWPLSRVLEYKTRWAAQVALFEVRALNAHGLTLVASGREPHYDVSDGSLLVGDAGSVRVTAGSAAALVDRFLAAPCTVRDNQYYQPDQR